MASFCILLAIFLWSSLGVIVRLAEVEIHTLIFYSLVVSIIVQGIIIAQKKYRKDLPPLRKLKYPMVLGIISLTNTFTFFYAFKNTTIANAVLTHYTAPVIVAFLSPFIIGEKITKRILAVILLSSTGLLVMIGRFSLSEGQGAGILAGLISGFAYAIIVIFLRLHSQKFNPLILAFFSNITIAVLLVPFIQGFPSRAIWSFLFMGIIHSTIAPVLYFKGLQSVTANRAAVLGYLEPVCAILFSIMFLNEIPGLHTVLGGILIIFSGYLTLREKDN